MRKPKKRPKVPNHPLTVRIRLTTLATLARFFGPHKDVGGKGTLVSRAADDYVAVLVAGGHVERAAHDAHAQVILKELGYMVGETPNVESVGETPVVGKPGESLSEDDMRRLEAAEKEMGNGNEDERET